MSVMAGTDNWMLHGSCRQADAPEMVDITTDHEHAAAVACCRGCPVHTQCAAWLAALPDDQRPVGVVAGLTLGRKNGRPTTHNRPPRCGRPRT